MDLHGGAEGRGLDDDGQPQVLGKGLDLRWVSYLVKWRRGEARAEEPSLELDLVDGNGGGDDAAPGPGKASGFQELLFNLRAAKGKCRVCLDLCDCS